jgi:peptidoglycan/LPS O-acetylase OafA/YrhL
MTTLLSGLFLKVDILKFKNDSGDMININFLGIFQTTGENGFDLIERLIPLSVLFILIPIVSIVAIFLFKTRKLQLKATFTLIILIIVLIALLVYYGITVIQRYHSELVPGIKMFIPVLILIFAILAYRGIKKDEDLVKSGDRLR